VNKRLVDLLLRDLPFSERELTSLIATAQFRYKVYQIPKRKPNQFRTIAQPAPEVKLIQRWLTDSIFRSLPIHRSATAYRNGYSIADHADKHAAKRFLLKMDFKDFFPSITAQDVHKHLTKYGKLSTEDITSVCRLVCWRRRETGSLVLSIGAPSSPILSNTVLYDFDNQVAKIASSKKVLYSRYADDLAFSTNRKGILTEIHAEVVALCERLEYPRLTINDEKTVFTSKAHRRSLVGLVLTPEGGTSLGRDKKRQIRSQLYRLSNNTLDPDMVSRLRGELAFAWSVEPSFIYSLLRQRGGDVFEKLGLPFTVQKQL
jgi:RNA-directed DNA polymerase